MPQFINKLQFIQPNVGYFPAFYPEIIHGFSWGKQAGNMQFSLGNPADVRRNVLRFFDALDLGKIKESVNMIPEHSDKIINIDKDKLSSLKSHRFGKSVRCDTILTDMPNITLTTKPADCTTAIVYCQRKSKNAVIGLIHSGRRGVELSLPRKSIKLMTKLYKCAVSDIKIGIIPHLFKENRKFENIDDLDKKVWKDFLEEQNGYFYPAETELAIKQYLDSEIKDENLFVYDIDTYESAAKGETFSYKYHLEMKKQGKRVPEGRFIVAVRKIIS